MCAAHRLLLIVDEVQPGIGRCGSLLARTQWGITPDPMSLGKGLGGGMPIGAVLARSNHLAQGLAGLSQRHGLAGVQGRGLLRSPLLPPMRRWRCWTQPCGVLGHRPADRRVNQARRSGRAPVADPTGAGDTSASAWMPPSPNLLISLTSAVIRNAPCVQPVSLNCYRAAGCNKRHANGAVHHLKEESTMKNPKSRRRLDATAMTISTALLLSACATASRDIATSSVSPLQYQPYDYQQLAAEAQRVQVRVAELGGRLDQAASNDKALVGVGMIIFWPALFALGGTKQQEAEYGRLRGEYDAIQQVSVQKKCGMDTPAAAKAAVAAASAAMGAASASQ